MPSRRCDSAEAAGTFFGCLLATRYEERYEERYGNRFIPEGMQVQDFGVTYDELEPHFDFAEKVFGTSGKAGNLEVRIHYDTRTDQSTHTTGGAVMGTSPRTSVVNKNLQSRGVPNVFVMGCAGACVALRIFATATPRARRIRNHA